MFRLFTLRNLENFGSLFCGVLSVCSLGENESRYFLQVMDRYQMRKRALGIDVFRFATDVILLQ